MPSLSDAIPEQLGLPVLAEIPLALDGAVPSPPDEPFLEGVRFVRAGLQWQASAPSVLVVVAVTPSDTSVEVTRYLSRSFAEAGRSSATILAINQRPLDPLLSLPADADLPPEAFARSNEVDRLVQQAGKATAIIYCVPAVSALSAIHSAETSLLLVEHSTDVNKVHQAMAACDTALVPAIAAAILKPRRPSRIPARLRRFIPTRFQPSSSP